MHLIITMIIPDWSDLKVVKLRQVREVQGAEVAHLARFITVKSQKWSNSDRYGKYKELRLRMCENFLHVSEICLKYTQKMRNQPAELSF